jgi:hypothetical protein
MAPVTYELPGRLGILKLTRVTKVTTKEIPHPVTSMNRNAEEYSCKLSDFNQNSNVRTNFKKSAQYESS